MSGRQEKNSKKCSWLWAICVLAVLVLVCIIYTVNNREDAGYEQTAEGDSEGTESGKEQEYGSGDTSKEENAGLEFPYELEENKLQVDSFFQYTGINPDCNNENCEEVASVQITNNSEEYLESAEISLELTDGSRYSFQVEDVPAGKKILAFDISNESYDGKTPVAIIESKSSYQADASLEEEGVSVTSNEEGVYLQNVSGENLSSIHVKFHTVLDEMYFGGKSSETSIDNLPSGESTLLDLTGTMLNEAEVVNISLS